MDSSACRVLAFPEGIPDAVHDYVLARLGGRFGGWEYGENDAGYCYSPMPEEPPTRKVAHDLFLGFNHRWSEKLHNYMVAMQNTTWGPYMPIRATVEDLRPNPQSNAQYQYVGRTLARRLKAERRPLVAEH